MRSASATRLEILLSATATAAARAAAGSEEEPSSALRVASSPTSEGIALPGRSLSQVVKAVATSSADRDSGPASNFKARVRDCAELVPEARRACERAATRCARRPTSDKPRRTGGGSWRGWLPGEAGFRNHGSAGGRERSSRHGRDAGCTRRRSPQLKVGIPGTAKQN